MLRRKAPRVEAEFIKFRMEVGDPVGYGPKKEHGTYVVEFRTAAGEQRARAYYDALQTERPDAIHAGLRHRRIERKRTPVCTENSDPGVLVMKPADQGM